MELTPAKLPEVLLMRPNIFGDARGYFFEMYRESYESLGISKMMQASISRSTCGVLRGLHFQRQQPQAKLVSVIRGAVFDVAVDIRVGSPTFGHWCGHVLDDENHHQLYIPIGFAHGFCVLSDVVDFVYQCSDYYHPQSEVGIQWNDPALAIEWPESDYTLSDKDQRHGPLSALDPTWLPTYSPKAADPQAVR